MTRVGWIGLGIMGAPMAERLLEAGFEVSAWSRRPPDESPAAIRFVDDPRDLAVTDVVVTMLPTGADVEQVLFGADGVFSGTTTDVSVVDMSTIGREAATRIADRVAAVGSTFVDAPVSGGPAAAAAGTLALMVGGEDAAIRRVEPMLAALGTVTRMGPVGSGQATKIANQVLIAGVMSGIAEAFALTARSGIDQARFYEAVRGGFGGSPLLDFAWTRLLAGDHAPGFKVGHFVKDLKIVEESARAVGLTLNRARGVRLAYEQMGPSASEYGTQALGWGDLDCATPDTSDLENTE